MSTSPLTTSGSDAVIKRSVGWVSVIRVVTLSVLVSLGGFYILVCLFGLLMNGPFEPEPGVSAEEHYRRQDSGYYRLEALLMIAKMTGYLAVVALPHRWILRSRVRFVLVFSVLCVAFSLRPFSLISDVVSSLGNKTELLNRLSWLPFDFLTFLFYAAAPVSLYLLWRYGRKVA